MEDWGESILNVFCKLCWLECNSNCYYRNGFISRKNLLVNGTFIIHQRKKKDRILLTRRIFPEEGKRDFLWIELKIEPKKIRNCIFLHINREREREREKKKMISFRTRIVPMARNRALIDWIVRSASLMRSFLLRSTS